MSANDLYRCSADDIPCPFESVTVYFPADPCDASGECRVVGKGKSGKRESVVNAADLDTIAEGHLIAAHGWELGTEIEPSLHSHAQWRAAVAVLMD